MAPAPAPIATPALTEEQTRSQLLGLRCFVFFLSYKASLANYFIISFRHLMGIRYAYTHTHIVRIYTRAYVCVRISNPSLAS